MLQNAGLTKQQDTHYSVGLPESGARWKVAVCDSGLFTSLTEQLLHVHRGHLPARTAQITSQWEDITSLSENNARVCMKSI